jgi:hypothetical protein
MCETSSTSNASAACEDSREGPICVVSSSGPPCDVAGPRLSRATPRFLASGPFSRILTALAAGRPPGPRFSLRSNLASHGRPIRFSLRSNLGWDARPRFSLRSNPTSDGRRGPIRCSNLWWAQGPLPDSRCARISGRGRPVREHRRRDARHASNSVGDVRSSILASLESRIARMPGRRDSRWSRVSPGPRGSPHSNIASQGRQRLAAGRMSWTQDARRARFSVAPVRHRRPMVSGAVDVGSM